LTHSAQFCYSPNSDDGIISPSLEAAMKLGSLWTTTLFALLLTAGGPHQLLAQMPALPFNTQAAQPAPAIGPAQASAADVQLADLDAVKQALGSEAAEVFEILGRVWNIVLINGADGKALITVGTLSGGLVLLLLGYLAAGIISRWVAAKLLSRLGLNRSAVSPVQSLTFYALLATFTMVSLNVLNVPLTVFSFLGGALAIGAGFGSQNIVNNFISGMILLVERPIRVGDVIQIDNLTGSVTQIGARSTKINTVANHEIIVPNSKLLETSVINWTLTDDSVCCTVAVGASYGSPTREVQRLLLQAAGEHPAVLKDPPPTVLFTDFGADALLFEVRFWVHLRESPKSAVESDLRFAIDELLADRGIVLAYPQRDVHLNVLRPVEVRLSPPFGQAKAAA
jgi:potassium-dependent mechanosensitive channel